MALCHIFMTRVTYHKNLTRDPIYLESPTHSYFRIDMITSMQTYINISLIQLRLAPCYRLSMIILLDTFSDRIFVVSHDRILVSPE
jgi:hypothetical protein